jgi:pyruvate dehydrogenase E2 component (dihydrolipoamide acetyltransferase)
MIEFKMPSLGADMEAGVLRSWHVQPGDTVKSGDIIAEVETQKGIIEIEVFSSGKINQLLIQVNEPVPVGKVMALINETGQEKLPVSAVAPAVQPETQNKPKAEHVRASPLARKIALEKNISLAGIPGTGPGGAITRSDVEGMAEKIPAASVTTGITFNENSIRKAIATAMSRSNLEIPHYYLDARINMEPCLNYMARLNQERPVKDRILPVAFLIKAVALALRDAPDLNAWYTTQIERKDQINIGIVISLRTGGIIIPSINQADKKNIDQIMESLTDLIQRGRNLKLKSSDISESTISISSIGEGFTTSMFGIIYPPQVALIGFGSIQEEAWAENGMLAARRVIHLTLAADHRATDGTYGNRFIGNIIHFLNHPEQL